MTRAIDLSLWQTNVNFDQVRLTGVELVVVKCSQGRYLNGTGAPFQDPRFHEHMQGALRAGLCVGVYHFFCARTEEQAVEEARFVLDTIGSYRSKIVYVFCDAENYGNVALLGLSKTQLTANIAAFNKVIRQGGYAPALYANRDHLLHYLNAYALNVPVWEAAYMDNNPKTAGNLQIMWQFTSSGSVNGVNGNVDVSEVYFDRGHLVIPKLAQMGIIREPGYWQREMDQVKYLGELLQNAASRLKKQGKPVDTVASAVDNLYARGVITVPAYWNNHVGDLKYLSNLLIQMASY